MGATGTHSQFGGWSAEATNLFTRVLLRLLAALVAAHVAAPVELAVALPQPRVLVRVVAAAAAHEVAAVRRGGRRPVAAPAVRAQRAHLQVLLAEVGRGHQVDKVRLRVRLEILVDWHLEEEWERLRE